MATLTHDDENLPETHEIFYLNSNMIDNEPFYKNFTTIHNVSRHHDEEKQFLHPTNDEYQTESFHFNKTTNVNHQNSSKTIDGYIFNLIQIVADIGYDSNSPFMHSPQNTINNSTLSNTIAKLGGIPGPLINEQRSHIGEQYFQQSYPNIYQRSPSMIQCYPVNHMNNKTSQISSGNQADNITHPSLSIGVTPHQMDEERFRSKIHGMYGFDDGDTMSSLSSRCSSIAEEDTLSSSSSSDRSSTPVILQTVDNFKPKQQITIREYYRANELSSLVVNRSLSPSSQETLDDNYHEQLTRNHPGLYDDQKPEIIMKPNPDEVTYKQSVSIRYLVPPTPPPPGPLIIREVLPPCASTPAPLIINQQEPAPPTPPPLILREAPPTPPPQQEAKIITKVLPPPPRQREITGHQTPLPAKPQSIIIEKWLPYKPAPPREVIYERVIEAPVVSEFQPGGIPIKQERRHPTDLYSKSSARVPISVHIEQPTSVSYLDNRQPSTFDQFARVTEQQLLELQQRVIKQLQTHNPWVVNQHQEQTNMYRQIPTQLTTPTLVINHPPIIRTTTTYAQRADVQPLGCCQPAFIYSSHT